MLSFGKKKKEKEQRNATLEDILWEAENKPSAQIDISSLGLTSFPMPVISIGKFGKESLLMGENKIASIPSTIGTFQSLRILDLHENELSELPSEIGNIQTLQVLDVHGNKLKSLPHTIGKLQRLETLHLHRNKLVSLPEEIGQLALLRTLNLADNKLSALPASFTKLVVLDTLVLTGNKFVFPEDTDLASAHSIMSHLCSRAGIPYTPPSTKLLPLLHDPAMNSRPHTQRDRPISEHLDALRVEDDRLSGIVTKHRESLSNIAERVKQDQQREVGLLTTRMLEESTLRAVQTAQYAKMIDSDSNKISAALLDNLKRRNMIGEELRESSKVDEGRVLHVAEALHKARNNPALFQALYEEEMAKEKEVFRRALQQEASRDAILKMLTSEENRERKMALDGFATKEQLQRCVLAEIQNYEDTMKAMMRDYERQLTFSRSSLEHHVAGEEHRTFEVFATYQKGRDDEYTRRAAEIASLQEQLVHLSKAEINKSDSRRERALKEEREQRDALAAMLAAKMKEHSLKTQEREFLLEEQTREEKRLHISYWQAKLDIALRSLSNLGGKTAKCDKLVEAILIQNGLSHLCGVFAERQVDFIVLRGLSHSDFTSFGISSSDAARIVRIVDDLLGKPSSSPSSLSSLSSSSNKMSTFEEEPSSASSHNHSQTNPMLESKSNSTPSASTPSAPLIREGVPEVAKNDEEACVICMNFKISILFMPCCHACSCPSCAYKIASCPLCRSHIDSKIQFFKS